MEPVPVARHLRVLIYSGLRICCGLLIALCVISGDATAQRFTLRGQIHPKAIPENDRGRVAPSLKLSYVTLTLAQSAAQKADLANLLAEQQNPSSPNYHRWLTPGQYADRFGVSAEDMSRIKQWLRGQGLAIAGEAKGRDWIAVSGEAAQVETAFATEIHQYVAEGETHFANATEPSVPAAIGGMVLSIRGLHDFRMKPANQTPKYTSAHGNHYLAPNDVAAIYDILPAYAAGINGTGQKMVVAGQSDVPTSDLTQFQSAYGLPANLPQMVLVGPDPGISGGDREESDLDLEWAGAVARNASISFVYSQNVMDAVQYAIDNNLAPVISMSYGSCEPENLQSDALSYFEPLARKANALGITWFNASGDNGAADCNDAQNPGLAVDLPASVPEITGVGGTAFLDGGATYWNAANDANSASALTYIPETSWNTSAQDGNLSASGGGASIYFSKPTWQVGPGVPGDNARHVPDVALNANPDHDGYLVYTDGSTTAQVFGGTSVPTPVMAGIAVLLNQYLGSGGLGNINPKLYALAQSNPAVFHDITTGDNIVTAQVDCGRRGVCPTPTPVGYPAGVGYDSVTGLGSIDGWKLLTCWTGTCASGSPPTLGPANTNLSLVSNLSSVGSQDYAFLTATATANDGVTTPQGVVQFVAGTTSLGSLTLVGAAGISTATLVVQGNALPAGTSTVTATYNGSSTTAPVTSSVLLSRAVNSSSNGTPVILDLTDAASFQHNYSPGMIMTVWGSTLSSSNTAESAGSVPLPMTMAGVAATVNGVAAPLYYVSPKQLNIQVPYQTAVNSAATLTINNNGQITSRTFQTGPASPGIFADQTGAIVPAGTAAHGQTATLYMTGTGVVTPAVATGSAPALTIPLASLPAPQNTTVTVGGVPASTNFVGVPYYLVGVTQINFQVPSGVPSGRQPVVVNVNGISSAAAYLTITN